MGPGGPGLSVIPGPRPRYPFPTPRVPGEGMALLVDLGPL